ncbi:GIY-YIG nuclease family protein [Thiohalocapsa halophila]|uniref:GIY-YIG nuclease family protein n=1 Tax=Thiohalocapsa halophila TaxID=69359 RepID=UPI0019035383|nr:GIY-YIG nuclease family protein [Thiohalocapsa halophila]
MNEEVAGTTSDDRPRRLTEIASALGKNPTGFLKFVRRRGFEPFKLQEGQNKPYYLTAQDAEVFLQRVKDEERLVPFPETETVSSGVSGVYAVEVPGYDGSTRIKIGWSDNIAERLNTYRTIIPDLRVLRVWLCYADWFERMTLAWAEKNGTQIGQELFEFEDKREALSSLDDLFANFGIEAKNESL